MSESIRNDAWVRGRHKALSSRAVWRPLTQQSTRLALVMPSPARRERAHLRAPRDPRYRVSRLLGSLHAHGTIAPHRELMHPWSDHEDARPCLVAGALVQGLPLASPAYAEPPVLSRTMVDNGYVKRPRYCDQHSRCWTEGYRNALLDSYAQAPPPRTPNSKRRRRASSRSQQDHRRVSDRAEASAFVSHRERMGSGPRECRSAARCSARLSGM